MTRKKALIFIIVLAVVIAFFEFAFVYKFDPAQIVLSHKANRQELPIFMVIGAVTFIPCILIGYARINSLLGFIPPFLLNSFLWYLLNLRFQRSPMETFGLEKNFLIIGIGLSIVSGSFGILIASFTRLIFKRIASEKEDEAENKTETGEDKSLSHRDDEPSENVQTIEDEKKGRQPQLEQEQNSSPGVNNEG